jgi:hypothetical protein
MLPLFMELEQRVITRVLYREGAEARDVQTRLSAQFRDATDSLESIQHSCLLWKVAN